LADEKVADVHDSSASQWSENRQGLPPANVLPKTSQLSLGAKSEYQTRVASDSFGDGQQLVGCGPIHDTYHHYVVAVKLKNLNWFERGSPLLHDYLDLIYEENRG